MFVKGLGFLTSLQLPGITHGGKEKFNNDYYMIFIVKISNLCYNKGDTPPSKSSLAAIGRRRTLSMEEYVSSGKFVKILDSKKKNDYNSFFFH